MKIRILTLTAALAVGACFSSCTPGTSLSVNPDGSISFSGSYKPKGVITEVRDEK